MKRKALIQKLKPYWKKYRELEEDFSVKEYALEKQIQKALGIRDLEIFHCDGSAVGIGNFSRTIKLICAEQLER